MPDDTPVIVRKTSPAIEDYRACKADFADCLIGRTDQARGCRETLAFDRWLKVVETFRVL